LRISDESPSKPAGRQEGAFSRDLCTTAASESITAPLAGGDSCAQQTLLLIDDTASVLEVQI
jgi:hypothetical protein